MLQIISNLLLTNYPIFWRFQKDGGILTFESFLSQNGDFKAK